MTLCRVARRKITKIENKRAVEQFNGREGETATFLSRCLVSLNLRGGGFAPRHLNRYVFRVGGDWNSDERTFYRFLVAL